MKTQVQLLSLAFVLAWYSLVPHAEAEDSTGPHVLTEEVVTRFSAANNGAGPTWCYGSPLIVRTEDGLYVSIIETGKDVPPLCNTRWQIWKREADGWQIVLSEQDYRQREPCPLVSTGHGLVLSANPSLTKPGTRYRPCRPTIFHVLDKPGGLSSTTELPAWSEAANFNDHSYRGLAADAERGEALLMNIDTKTSEQFVSLRDREGVWDPRGKLEFPIRAAYPQIAMRHGAAHVLAIGDIREPNPEWQALKREVTKRDWDYVFRRLFYSVAPDIGTAGFTAPIEIDSVEETAGHILNLDVHIDATGAAHLLYLKRPHYHAFLRDRFFPGEPMTAHLEHVVVKGQKVTFRQTIAQSSSNGNNLEPAYARFHVGPGERLNVIIAGTIAQAGKPRRQVNVIQGISPAVPAQMLGLTHPFRTFFTASPRGGSQPSDIVDLFGTADDVPNLRYAQIRL